MVSMKLLNLRVAYLGGLGFPPPPQGYAYLIDDAGNYLTDDDNNLLIVEAT